MCAHNLRSDGGTVHRVLEWDRAGQPTGDSYGRALTLCRRVLAGRAAAAAPTCPTCQQLEKRGEVLPDEETRAWLWSRGPSMPRHLEEVDAATFAHRRRLKSDERMAASLGALFGWGPSQVAAALRTLEAARGTGPNGEPIDVCALAFEAAVGRPMNAQEREQLRDGPRLPRG